MPLTVRRILQTLIWKSRVGHFRMTLIWRYYSATRLTRLSAKIQAVQARGQSWMLRERLGLMW